MTETSTKARKFKEWWDTIFSIETYVYVEDLKVMKNPYVSQTELRGHVAYMTSVDKRNTKVSLRKFTHAEKEQFDAAMDKEVDQWISNSVFTIATSSGVPVERIMSMIWVLTWQPIPDTDGDSKAKASMVVKGFTVPDLTTVRAEAPTLSNFGRHLLLHMIASSNFSAEMRDVSIAFLQGDLSEVKRDFYAVHPTI